MENVKIILDADVLIHFAKAEKLSLLPTILPRYKYTILSVVYEEVESLHTQIDNQILFFNNISIEEFKPRNEMLIEYSILRHTYGKGESACMAYCKYTHNVIGSSNLRDIKVYCEKEKISYLTTIDFLYYAYLGKLMSADECNEFIEVVNNKGSKLPNIDITKYKPNTILF
jgi:hypothetical protein